MHLIYYVMVGFTGHPNHLHATEYVADFSKIPNSTCFTVMILFAEVKKFRAFGMMKFLKNHMKDERLVTS